jgi:hypothetical protein
MSALQIKRDTGVACFRVGLEIPVFAMQGRESMAPDPVNYATACKISPMVRG